LFWVEKPWQEGLNSGPLALTGDGVCFGVWKKPFGAKICFKHLRQLKLLCLPVEFCRLKGVIKPVVRGSGRKAVKHRRPSRSAPELSRKDVDGMGCGWRRDEGLGRKAEVARGGWAEDGRRRPATCFFRGDPSFSGSSAEGLDAFRVKRIHNRFHSHDRVSSLGLKP